LWSLSYAAFGEETDLFYRYWKKACDNLGIKDIDLYGGTKHSTAVYLGQFFTPEQIKTATMHSTNKAFERYFRIQHQKVKSIYEKSKGNYKGTKIIPLKKK